MLRVVEKIIFQENKVLLVSRDTDTSENDYEEGTYEIHTYNAWSKTWNKKESFSYTGHYNDVNGWGEVLDYKALPRFKDYCLATLSDTREEV